MKVIFPARVINRHVGGNTTYALQLKDGLEQRGIATGLMPMLFHPGATMLMETLYGAVRRKGEVIHYSADTGALFPPATESVVTVHGVASRWTSVARSKREETLWRFRVNRAIASSSRTITVSRSSADDVAEVFGVDRTTIDVIPHGVDSRAYSIPTELSMELAAKLPHEFALYVGNLEPRKNLTELIGAFNLPEVSGLGLPLVVAGRPAWAYDEIMEAIDASTNIIYLRFVSDEDRRALMQKTSLFVFPSLYEGFGMPVLEALAAGAPVACSDRGSLAEVAGPSWRLTDLSSAGLAADIHSALSDSEWATEISAQGRIWAERFSWDRSIESHLAIYNEVSQ